MSTTTIKLGPLHLSAVEYGSQGNAILGIRDSGKTYTASYFAERLFDAGIPFITFDPIGVWRFMRVPGKGKGYPVVVAGGKDGDLPLTVAGAPEIVRAAMRNGVSLVIDLFDMKLSKADWRRIVTAAVRVLLHENQAHGLRHVFLEEAAEFIPQKPSDWDVYAEIEKLARMGGNARLGYTLVNQRSQEVSKAILELCENVFLHRQRGKNSLENLDKWLAIAGAAEQKEIIKSLPGLPQGQCWAWIGGDKPQPPMLVKVPQKNSLHPDRRVMRGDEVAGSKPAVEVGKFVASMRGSLTRIEEEAKANDPKVLRAEIARLQGQMREAAAAKAGQTPDPKAIEAADQRGYERGYLEALTAVGVELVDPIAAVHDVEEQVKNLRGEIANLTQWLNQTAKAKTPSKIGIPRASPAVTGNGVRLPATPKPPAKPEASGDGTLTGAQRQLLQSLRWWKEMGHNAPSRVQVATICGWRVTSGHIKNVAGSLRSIGLIDYPREGAMCLTPAGEAAAPDADLGASLVESARAIMTGPQLQAFDAIPADGSAISREQLCESVGWNITSGHVKNVLGSLRSMEIVDYPSQGSVARADWLRGG